MVKRNQNLQNKIGVLPTSHNLIFLMIFNHSRFGYIKLKLKVVPLNCCVANHLPVSFQV